MKTLRLRSLALLTALAIFGSACELMVQLDRSLADAGADVGCPICTDAAIFDDAADATPDSAGETDGGASDSNPRAEDAQPDGRIPDAGGKGSG